MSRLDRFVNWLYPRPASIALTPEIVTHSTLDAQGALAIERYAAIANLFPPSQVGRPSWPDRDPVTYENQGYRALSLIFRCVNLIAHASGVAPIRVYDEAADNETVDDHGIRRLMRQPNPHMGESAFWRSVTKRTAIAGFCVVEKERNRIGEVIALNPLRSAWLRAVPRGKGVYDWEYRVPGVATPYKLKAEDVIPFVWTESVDGSPYGVPPLAVCIRDAALLTKMVDFLGNLFERGGVPLYGLIPADDVEIPDQGTADALVEGFVQRKGGLARAGIPMILEGIKSVERLQMDLDELAYTDIRDVSELEIVRAFGVPPTKAIIRVGLEHSDSRANAEVDDATFYQDTIVPLWSIYDDVLTTHLMPDFETLPTTRAIEFDVSDVQALQEDRNARAPWVIQAFNAGALSQHMMLGELGIPLPTTPDFYLRSIAVEAIPVEQPIPQTPTATTTPAPVSPQTQPEGQGDELGTLRPFVIRELPNAEPGAFLVTAGPMRAGESLADYAKRATAVVAPNGHHGPSERLASIGNANRKAYLAIARTRQASIAAFFKAEGERILSKVTLASLRGPSETFALPKSFWDDENTELVKVMRALYLLCGETAFTNAADQIGVEIAWDLSNPKIKDVTSLLADRVKDITEESRKQIADAVAASAEAGETIDQLKDRLREKFAGWSEHRAETVARTESMVGYSEGSVLAYDEAGIEKAMILDNPNHTEGYNASDGHTCASRNGLVVPLDKAMTHIRAEHPNGSACLAPVLSEED